MYPLWLRTIQGGVRKGRLGERTEILVDQKIGWLITEEHKKTLSAISKRFNVLYNAILVMDQCIRTKRAKGTTVFEGKTLFYAVHNASSTGDHICAWFDISLSIEPTSKHVYESASAREEEKQCQNKIRLGLQVGRVPRECNNCHKIDDKEHRHYQCNRCRQAIYCSKECQKKHWVASHKQNCWTLQ